LFTVLLFNFQLNICSHRELRCQELRKPFISVWWVARFWMLGGTSSAHSAEDYKMFIVGDLRSSNSKWERSGVTMPHWRRPCATSSVAFNNLP